MYRAHGSERARALHFSLLTSLGLFPFACGGSVVTAGGDAGQGGQAPNVGNPAGSSPVGRAGQGGAVQIAGTGQGGALQMARAGRGGDEQGPRPIPVCFTPTVEPITQLVKCADGTRHRPQAHSCGASGGAGGQGSSEPGAAGVAGEAGAPFIGQPCQSDSECSGLVRGYCSGLDQGPVDPECASGCVSDSDCGPRELCFCDGSPHFGVCAPATCRVDSDCAPGSRCADSVGVCGLTTFACIDTRDECLTSADCGAPDFGACVLQSSVRVCSNIACGRPFLVAERARLARVVPSGQWLDEELALPDLTTLSPTARALLAAHWADMGQMEHASIAAFARFNLQLLSLGAPASLIETCTRAIADETKHAKLCFAFASHYGGTPVGPGRLDIDQCLTAVSSIEVMKLVVREGCLGETSAALEAREALGFATDRAVERVLSQIAEDEQRHAELAFQFLVWALDQSSDSERSELAAEARTRALHFAGDAEAAEGRATGLEIELAGHGLLPPAQRIATRHRAASSVALPLLDAVFHQSRRRAAAASSAVQSPSAHAPERAAEGFAAS